MSFNLTRMAWDVVGLDAPSRLVLLALADIADEDGVCWPSVRHLADKTGLGDRAIRSRLAGFEACGLLSRSRRHRSDGTLSTYRFELSLAAPHAASPPAPPAAQEPTISEPTMSSSLRSEDGLNAESRLDTPQRPSPTSIAQEYWRWHVDDRGRTPTMTFLALQGVTGALFRAGYTPDEIIDAMKFTKVMTAKAVADQAAAQKHAREQTTNTQAIPAAVVRAFAKCEPWFNKRGFMSTSAERGRWMRLCASQISFGYGPGETMLRMAVVLRTGDSLPFALSNANVDRFNGEPADYPDAMERAYVNQFWSAK